MKLKISIAHKSGVSAEPEILDHTIDEYDEFMIIATDGVWDVWKKKEFSPIILSG